MTFSPASPSSVLKCPITSIARGRHFTTTTRVLQFVVLLCKLEPLFFKHKRDLHKFRKAKTKCSQMSSSWKWPIGQSNVSSHRFRTLAKPAFVTFFNFILKLRGAHLFLSFYLQFIFCILAIGRNRPSRTKKKGKKSENRTVPLRPQDYPSAVAVVRKWSRD